jgi:spore coat protein A, manganese oxidase
MSTINRRQFLERILASASGFALAEGAGYGQSDRHNRLDLRLSRWVDRLPIPKTLAPLRRNRSQTVYQVRMVEFTKQIHSELPPTKLWGYEGQYPGPVIEAERGESVQVRWENRLPTRHIFEIDPAIHGAMPPAPAVRTVPHLHGSRSPSYSDGLPEKWFTPGLAANYTYPNDQRAATLWYHDHALGITRLNVYAGLSGLFLIRDEDERRLGLPDGEHEIPLVVQDRTLDPNGQLVYAPSFEDGQEPPPGHWAPEFFGRLPVVNGTIYPYVEVEPRPYRLRLLNASNSRFFNFYFNLAKSPTDIPRLVPFQQIGSDGGLLARPADLKTLLLGPAERADLLFDFSQSQGQTVTLSNNAATPFPGWEFTTVQHQALYELLQFRVTRPVLKMKSFVQLGSMPAFSWLDRNDSQATRDFVLSEMMDREGHSLGVKINGKGYDEPVTEIVQLGATEIWRFINSTDDAHPMHLHLVQFQILERQGYDVPAFLQGKVQLVGRVRPAPENEAGWKDTAIVYPREVLTILVRFEGFTGRYVFHCHMLEHEDNDMMRPYEVVGKQATASDHRVG